MADKISNSDLVLPNDSYAHVLDETKGHITCYVGPSKTQLANTDKLVTYDEHEKRYRQTDERHLAVQTLKVAPEGWYIILKNPAIDRRQPAPSSNESLAIDRIEIGRKIHIPGPVSFALWPGQMAKVVQGHHLRTNQYLIVRVYDAEAAKKNWANTIIQKTSAPIEPKPPASESSEEQSTSTDSPQSTKSEGVIVSSDVDDSILADGIEFTVGKLMIVKGTDVSFFIPPTGIEVVKDSDGSYIREAVTLERLFYCILLDEGGSKRYIRGPAVVFPSPTEIFQTHQRNGITTRKFRAIELNEISGIYVKVIAPYEEGGKKYKEGDELFITGKEQSIYYRRDEHQIVRYGDNEIHYATAIPKGEARYVLNRLTGEIETINGPAMLLPDPRTKVIVRRLIPQELCKLMYPGNSDAMAYNNRLSALGAKPTDFVTDNQYAASCSHDDNFGGDFPSRGVSYSMSKGASPTSMGSSLKRAMASVGELYNEDSGILNKSTTYTAPRTVTLGSKYDGAVCVKIWTGYAIIIVNGVGERKVIEGPATYNLAYDEYPEVITMSTGKPKNTDRLLKDIYLRTKNNKISDVVTVETKDLVSVSMKLSYRVNFVGEKEIWFNVENYVKFLCDHMRSKLKGFAQTIALSDFYADSVKHIRDVVLGPVPSEGSRGFLFPENNMFVGDVEVLGVTIDDRSIADTIRSTQEEIVSTTISVSRKAEMVSLKTRLAELEKKENQLRLDGIKEANLIETTKIESEMDLTQKRANKDALNIEIRGELEQADKEQSLELSAMVLNARISEQASKDEADLDRQAKLDEIHTAELKRLKESEEVTLTYKEKKAAIKRDNIAASAAAIVEQMKAVTPGLVEALQANAQISVLTDVLPAAIPLSIVEGQSVSGTLSKLLQGTSIGKVIENLTPAPTVED